jgi:DNA-binding NarL/FixJ family response regulator
VAEPSYRTLVVDDHEQWRYFVCSTLRKRPGLLTVGEAADGLEAIYKTQELQPDLILLDIGLPRLNGIQAARKIRELSPKSKILFVSENASWEIAEAALGTGADGYVLKSSAASDLLRAVETILDGGRFVSASLAGQDFADGAHAAAARLSASFSAPSAAKKGCHAVEFYAGDAALVDGFARFVETAVNRGSAVTFIATESHQAAVLQRLKADAVDVEALAKQGRYTSVDVIEALRAVMGSDGLPDRVRCAEVLGDLVVDSAATGHSRVAACGEFAPFLLNEGRIEAAIQMERLTDEFVREHDIDIFCGYVSDALPAERSGPILERIRLEHSAAHGQ